MTASQKGSPLGGWSWERERNHWTSRGRKEEESSSRSSEKTQSWRWRWRKEEREEKEAKAKGENSKKERRERQEARRCDSASRKKVCSSRRDTRGLDANCPRSVKNDPFSAAPSGSVGFTRTTSTTPCKASSMPSVASAQQRSLPRRWGSSSPERLRSTRWHQTCAFSSSVLRNAVHKNVNKHHTPKHAPALGGAPTNASSAGRSVANGASRQAKHAYHSARQRICLHRSPATRNCSICRVKAARHAGSAAVRSRSRARSRFITAVSAWWYSYGETPLLPLRRRTAAAPTPPWPLPRAPSLPPPPFSRVSRWEWTLARQRVWLALFRLRTQQRIWQETHQRV